MLENPGEKISRSFVKDIFEYQTLNCWACEKLLKSLKLTFGQEFMLNKFWGAKLIAINRNCCLRSRKIVDLKEFDLFSVKLSFCLTFDVKHTRFVACSAHWFSASSKTFSSVVFQLLQSIFRPNKSISNFHLIELKLMFDYCAEKQAQCCLLCTFSFSFLKFICCATDAFVYPYVRNTHNWPVPMKVLSESRYFFSYFG